MSLEAQQPPGLPPSQAHTAWPVPPSVPHSLPASRAPEPPLPQGATVLRLRLLVGLRDEKPTLRSSCPGTSQPDHPAHTELGNSGPEIRGPAPRSQEARRNDCLELSPQNWVTSTLITAQVRGTCHPAVSPAGCGPGLGAAPQPIALPPPRPGSGICKEHICDSASLG